MKREDFQNYYGLENYLFNEVSKNFAETKTISTFDFFCIVIWKANRSKSKIAKRLLNRGRNLDEAVCLLIKAISTESDMKNRLRVIIEDWKFRLPMASAILTGLFPTDFTIYDVRVCDMLNDFKDAQNKARFDDLWNRYEKYIQSVRVAVSGDLTLRDKDRWLWGKSFALQLEKDIQNNFKRSTIHFEPEA
jgi:hypothetical protein